MKRYDSDGYLIDSDYNSNTPKFIEIGEAVALLKRVLPHVENTAKIIEDFGIHDARCKDVLDLRTEIKSIIGEP